MAQDHQAHRRLRPVLVWSGLSLLTALAIALALLIATLALQLGTDPAPSPCPPIQISPPAGHAAALTGRSHRRRPRPRRLLIPGA
jgi:hypothetical protein